MKTLIAIPCMDMMHTQFVCSLISQPPLADKTEITFGANSLIYDTRNQLTEKAIKEGFDRVLWIDSDMTFPPEFSHRLAARLDEGYEFVSGLYITRKEPPKPVIFKKLTEKPEEVEFYLDYPRDSLFEIAACGFGGVMMTVDLLKRVMEKFGRPFSPIFGYGEDISFCIRAGLLGAKLYCDSSIKMGHVGFKEITEETYLERAVRLYGENKSIFSEEIQEITEDHYLERIKHEQEDQKQNEEHGESRAVENTEHSMAD